MKKPRDSQQVVDDYVEALLGDVLGASEAQPDPTEACAAADIAAEPEVSLAAAPVVQEVAVLSSFDEEAQAAGPVRIEAISGATPPIEARPAEPVRVEAMKPAMSAAAMRPATVPIVPAPAPMPAAQRWLRVTVGDDSYALELLSVQEVVRVAPIVAMRGAGRAVLGVMNLRGRIVPVFDLGLWLGTACVRPDERSRIVVVERHDELIGVLVSGVDDVVTLGRDRIEPPLPGTRPGAILGIARVVAAPTVLLDAGALFA